MGSTRACGGCACAGGDVGVGLCSCWGGWPFMSCLAPGGLCCACLPSSSRTTPHQAGVTNPPPPAIALPQVPEITLEQLEAIIPLIQQEVDRLDQPSTSSSSTQAPISQTLGNMLGQWEEHKKICTSFINSLPNELTSEVAGNGRSLLMSLLTKALGGVGGVHWLSLGFAFIAWSLDSMNNIIQNRADCIEILRRSLRLLRNTKQIWKATHIDNASRDEDLQDSIERAFRCAIFCTSNLTDAWILRFFKATSVKDAIDMFAKELDSANIQNIEFMMRHNLESETSKLERQPTFHVSDDDIVGGQKVTEDAVAYLKTSSDDIMAICLHGMGGIGKSSLGLKIFTEFQKSMYRDCRVELQFNETNQGELCDIQKQIIEKVCKHETSKFSNLVDGRQNMEKGLNKINDPIFLYVDNVLEHRYLPELLPQASCFPKGSRILITSRGEYIKHGIVDLGIKEYKLVEVRKLEKQQAQQLFWKQLQSQGEHLDTSEVESLENRVLELCDGLPLALVVVGKYIANEKGVKNAEVWREVVHAMQTAQPLEGIVNDKLYSRIMFSVQNLDHNVKRAFLDTIFLLDSCKDVLWGSIQRLVSHQCLKVLEQRALVRKEIKEDFFYRTQTTAEIHDVIKAMGKRMVENDEQELRIAGMNEFEEHKNTLEKVVALHDVVVDASVLKRMPRLRLLERVKVQGECQEVQLRHLRLVHNLRCLTTRVFDWSKFASLKEVYWWGSLYGGEGAPNVSNLEVFKHDKIAMGFEALRLDGWRQLKDVGVIETLTCLKELQLEDCIELECLPEGISRLTGLNWLDLGGCEKLKCLPQSISSLICLEVLSLSNCKSVQSLPEGVTSLTGLKELNLYGCESLQSIPEGIGSLTAVTQITLRWCKRLESIPEGATGLMSGLKRLDLEECCSLRSLPEGVSGLTGLTSLVLRDCRRLQALPEGIAGLSGLIEFDLRGCRALRSLPEKLSSSLTGLTNLDLSYCRSLQALPQNLGFMTCLRQLHLSSCSSLQFLPVDISKLTGLVLLDLSSCNSLQSIEGVTTLTALINLDVQWCSKLQSLPEGLTRLASLRYMDFSGCSSLESIPEGLDLYKLHRERPFTKKGLDLNFCQSLKSLPQNIGSFTLLEKLKLNHCTSLESLPEGVTRLSKLAELSLLGCRSLQCLPRGLIGSLTGLTELQLGECAMPIQPLLEEVSCNITSLKVLRLSKCENLQSLPPGITSLMSLEDLSLSGCKQFQLLPHGMANWKGLQRLDLSGCQSLQSLPQELTTLTALSHLNLSGCACLQSLPQGIFTSLAGLKELNMSECRGLQPQESQEITRLTGLTSLDLSEAEHLVLLAQGSLASLTGLKRLTLSRCTSLQSLPEGMAALAHLEWLDLSGCTSLDQSSAWEIILSFKGLRRLTLSGWETMQALPEGIACLESLFYIDLSRCSSLLYLPESVTKLTNLQQLTLAECKSLQSLPLGITSLVELLSLDLSGCTSLEPLPEELTIWMSGILIFYGHMKIPESSLK